MLAAHPLCEKLLSEHLRSLLIFHTYDAEVLFRLVNAFNGQNDSAVLLLFLLFIFF